MIVRSVSLYALSDVVITLDQGTDREFARQQVFNRIGDISLPTGVTPSISPLTSPSGLIYRYTLQSPDRSPTELKTFEDWTVEPQFKSVRRRRRRFRLRRRHDAISGAGRPGEARGGGALDPAGGERARRQQQQCRRRLLLRRRPILLCPRPRPPADARRHRQCRRRGAERHSDAGQGHRPGHARHRAAARPIRHRPAERRRRGRHHASHRREDPGRAQARRGQDPRAQHADPAQGREGRPLLRPLRPRSR